MATQSAGSHEYYRIAQPEKFVDFQRREGSRVIQAAVCGGWSWILTAEGHVTVQESFRCSTDIVSSTRAGRSCHRALLSVCPFNCGAAIISLSYAPPVQAESRGRAAHSLTETYLVVCDGDSVRSKAVHGHAVAAETPTAAAWLSERSVLLGTASGVLLCLTLPRAPPSMSAVSASSGHGRSPKLAAPVASQVLSLQQHRQRIDGLAVLGLGGGPEDEQPWRCVLVATSTALFCFPGAGSITEMLAAFDSPTSVTIGLAIQLDEEASPNRAHLSLTAETATSFQQQLAWVTDSHVHLATLDVSPDRLAGGWDLVAGDCKSLATQDITLRPVHGAAMAQWQLLLLEGAPDGTNGSHSPQEARIAVVSRITGSVVQRVALPPAVADAMALTLDPVPPPVGLGHAAADALYVVGAGSLARLLPQQAAAEVWADFISIGEHAAALALIDELAEAARFRALEEGALAGLGEADAGRSAAEQRLAAARAGVLTDMAHRACEAGDYVRAADALGDLSAEDTRSAEVPDFRETVLWFHALPDDESHVAAAKAAGLERYLTRKLRHYRSAPADATATALALWLLEVLLARQHAAMPVAALQPQAQLASHPSTTSLPASEQAPERIDAGEDPAAWLTVQQLLEDYKAHLPFAAVEQVLRDSNCRTELVFATRLYGDWPSLFELLMPDDVTEALNTLPKLPRASRPSAVSALLRTSPQQACRALATRPDLQAIPVRDVTNALCPFAKPHVAADVRQAAIGYMSEAVYTRGSRAPCTHNLFIALLVLQEDGRELHMYLDSDKARWTDEERAEARHSGPFVFDARRAVQLAQQHGKRRAAMQLLVELEAFEDALALASSYDERLSVVEEVTDPDQRNALWLALIQLEVDAAEGASGDLGNRIAAIDRCIEDRMVRGTLAVEDALRFLPEQETLASYKQVLLKHMEASSQKVQQTLADTYKAVHMNGKLLDRMRSAQRRTAAVSSDSLCHACHLPLHARPRCSVPHGGHVPPFQVYPSGAVYHTSCAVQRLMLLSSDVAYKQQLESVLKVLAAVPRQGRRNAESADRVDAAQSQLAVLLKEGDPSNSERVLKLAALPYPDRAEDWRIEGR